MKKSKTFFALVAIAALSFQLSVFSSFAQYTKLLDFAGNTNGASPYSSLISDGTFLYGMTAFGGTNDDGVIFKIKSDGTGYVKLLDFAGASNGKYPKGSLISDGTFLYGMTSGGGTNSMGVVFKIKTDGTGYVKLLDFAVSNGDSPFGSLISDGTFLFGMTYYGGANNIGVIFKIKPDGTGYVKLLDFAGTSNGQSPQSSLISDGTFLYGMTRYGGANNYGVIFKIKPDGTGYVKLLDFAGASNGQEPWGSLISDGTFLYGTTNSGGANGYGVIFKIKPDGTGYVKLLDFAGTSNGKSSGGSLISDGVFLYGMTQAGGAGNKGVIFKIKPDGTGYVKLFDFTGSANGQSPSSSLISDGTFLYGMTYGGGTNTFGVTFRYCITPLAFTQSPTVCAGQSLTIGNHTYTASATYHDTLISNQGCDSMVTTNLTVLPANTFSQTFTRCAGQSVTIGNHTYNSNGTYHDTLASYQGCDSMITTQLTINTVDVSVSVSNTTITSNATGATYQWINCSGNTVITGQSNQSYTATINGSYAVIVTNNNCSDTSACQTITTTGIIENSLVNGITINPNPFSSQTTITFIKEQKNTNIKIIDELGKEVKTINFTGKELVIEKGEMKAGTYFLQVKTEKGNVSKKIIINK